MQIYSAISDQFTPNKSIEVFSLCLRLRRAEFRLSSVTQRTNNRLDWTTCLIARVGAIKSKGAVVDTKKGGAMAYAMCYTNDVKYPCEIEAAWIFRLLGSL